MGPSESPASAPASVDQSHPSLQPPATADPQQLAANGLGTPEGNSRRPKGPSVRRACVSCHTGKTRCSETLPCQSCLKRGLADSCAYPEHVPDPNVGIHTGAVPAFTTAPMAPYPALPPVGQQGYYDYAVNTFPVDAPNHTTTHAPSHAQSHASSHASSRAPAHPPASAPPPSTPQQTYNRPAKRPRELTEEEAAAITRNFTRGDFFVGNSAPVRIDTRLPVRLLLAEGDRVHFTIGELSDYPNM